MESRTQTLNGFNYFGTREKDQEVYGINDLGVVTGYCAEPDGNFVWKALFPGERGWSYALAINQLGHVAGTRINARDRSQAFVWTPQAGGLDIDDRPLRTDTSHAMAINDAGQVVGQMWHTDANGNSQEGVFYWDATNGFLDLRSLLDPDDPLTGQLSEVYPEAGMRINASGQITLNGDSTGGQSWAMVLTPVQ